MKGLLALGLFLSTVLVVSPLPANAESEDALASAIMSQLSENEVEMLLTHLESADQDEKKKKKEEELPWYIRMVINAVRRGGL